MLWLSDLSRVRAYLENEWSRIHSGRTPISDFIFTKKVKLGKYRSATLPPQALIASVKARIDPRAAPLYGERVPYIIKVGPPNMRVIDMAVDPHEVGIKLVLDPTIWHLHVPKSFF